VNEKRIKSYPAVKICRFGTDLTVKGQGIGSALIDFIRAYFITNNKTGCRFLTVDAYKLEIPFYLKNSFEILSSHDNDGMTQLLYYDLKSIV
jgi:GNAT superfamily N-acetyltransferase